MPIEFVLAQNLVRLRKKRRMSQETMSRYSGLTIQGYREIEEERYVPTIVVLIRLAKALNCSLDELLPLDEIE
ncbi:MAG: helix-turn-helix transcriptional regulator [bacterium]|nr:helix-turn-helix transcriptional regulator [bacterium]